MEAASRRTYVPIVKRLSFIAMLALCCAALPFGQEVNERRARSAEVSPLKRHFRTAIRYTDAGERSSEYRDSIGYLRQHAPELTAEVRRFVLESSGSFRKWQVTYLLGEVGDESTIALLRELLSQSIPEASVADPRGHAIDLRHAEEVMSRMQAVTSISRIAWIRPYLKGEVVTSLVEVAREVPIARSSAIYELRRLLGDDVYHLRGQLPREHWWELDRFVPPPNLQGKLAERMQERDRVEREQAQGKVSCRLE